MSKRKSTNYSEEPQDKKNKTGFWAGALLKSIEDPNLQISADQFVCVIKDQYPKAAFHYLVISKKDIPFLKSVNKDHLTLLTHMHNTATKLAADAKHSESNFMIGYHAEPSMLRLHLHVISDDMNSSSLKTKKHWNSFTTDFFLKSEDVLSSLKEDGKITFPSKETCKKYLQTPLVCHKCDYIPKHIPDLKNHVLNHL